MKTYSPVVAVVIPGSGPIPFYQAESQSNLVSPDEPSDLIDDFKKADQRDKLRLAIAGALGSGELSERDIHDIFSSARANEGIFRLSAPLHLIGDEPMGEISKGSYEQY